MAYTLNRTFPDASFADIERRTRAALAGHGFGILTEIDVQATMKAKIDEDLESYLILGACNPKMAFAALAIEPRIGAMLPCNVVVRRHGHVVEVSAIDPAVAMEPVGNSSLAMVAAVVRDMLVAALAKI
ncbi:DUF302 domain-containing protein [Pelagibacterium montanilacus]|uniref:DUF302 domain-containing protein n=1 Tax=Pelagibacterium montanilacus TaxID=2185280 RepID=UPI000F8DFEE7|nr:DUF302 domain-containing protein [Pelagibacterium montanilacus]